MWVESEDIENACVVLSFALIFYGMGLFIRKYDLISSKVLPKKRSLWFNTLGSLIHSSIVSICCIICFAMEPYLAFAMIATSTTTIARMTTFMSLGYFVYDFYDTTMHFKLSNSWPVLLHHILVIGIFGTVAFTVKFYNYLIVALTCEVNTIFLHLRQLFQLADISKSSPWYRTNRDVNLVTFLVFRIATLVWMIVGAQVIYKDDMPIICYYVGLLGMWLMMLLNVIILWRVIKKDYFKAHTLESKETLNSLHD